MAKDIEASVFEVTDSIPDATPIPALSTALADALTAIQQADAIFSDLETYAD